MPLSHKTSNKTILVVKPIIEHRARKYLDPVTGKIHITPIPGEIRKGGLLGADITAAVVFMKGGCHMSYTTIQQFFKELFELDISRGSGVLEKMLGKDFAGIVCADYWGAYRKREMSLNLFVIHLILTRGIRRSLAILNFFKKRLDKAQDACTKDHSNLKEELYSIFLPG